MHHSVANSASVPPVHLLDGEMVSDPQHGIVGALHILKRNRRFLVITTLAAGLLSGVIAWFIPSYYVAVSTILSPVQNRSIANAIIGQIGPMAALAGGDFGLRDASEQYTSLLHSRTIADNLIEMHHLKDVYGHKDMEDLREKLSAVTKIQVLKGGLISISVTDSNAQRAADLANSYVEQLYQLNSKLAVDEASQRRLFFEHQLDAARQQMNDDEQRLRGTQERTGIVQLDAQAKATVESAAKLRAEIAAKEIEIGSMRTFATDTNPTLIRAEQELSGMRAELKKSQGSSDADGPLSVAKLPTAGLEYTRRVRDLKFDEAMVEALVKQYEIARIDQAKSAPLVQVVDGANVPTKRAGPPRLAIILCAMLSALVGMVALVFFRAGAGQRETFLSRLDRL